MIATDAVVFGIPMRSRTRGMSMLTCTPLEPRDCPAATPYGYVPGYDPMPGYDGPYMLVGVGDYRATVAGMGGSVRVRMVNEFTGAVPADVILFDPAFRGGGRATVVNGELVVAPGPGGGPVIAVIDPDTMTITNRLLPYAESFRGGIQVATADVNGDGREELLTLPGDGGGPILKAIDADTGAEVLSFLVGPVGDRRGYEFVPAGTDVQLKGPGTQGLYLAPGGDVALTFGVTWAGVFVG